MTGPGCEAPAVAAVVTPPPPRLTASYQALPGHPADGYPTVSRVLLGQLAGGFPPAAAVQVCTPGSSLYSAAGGWARLADAGCPEARPRSGGR